MNSNRLEAFSDGVLAIIITIMVLEMKAPEEASFEALASIIPVFVSYLMSFIYLGIYWNNHHHLLQVVKKVNGGILWANLYLLFWLSLIPFVTSWIGESQPEAIPVALYGAVLLMSSIAYRILEVTLLRHDKNNSSLRQAIHKGLKETISTIAYLLVLPLAFVNIWISIGLFVFVAILWVIPDKRLEKAFHQ